MPVTTTQVGTRSVPVWKCRVKWLRSRVLTNRMWGKAFEATVTIWVQVEYWAWWNDWLMGNMVDCGRHQASSLLCTLYHKPQKETIQLVCFVIVLSLQCVAGVNLGVIHSTILWYVCTDVCDPNKWKYYITKEISIFYNFWDTLLQSLWFYMQFYSQVNSGIGIKISRKASLSINLWM